MNRDGADHVSIGRHTQAIDDAGARGRVGARVPGLRAYRFLSRLPALLSGLLVAVASASAAAPAATCHAATGAQRNVLIELYTSEGCSSCPPADRWFAGLAHAANPEHLSLLAFHVDYWDSIGWPDRFGNHAFSVRQGDRVRAVTGGSTVYTPQVMLDERVGFPWSSTSALVPAIRAIVAQPSQLSLDVDAKRTGDGFDVALRALPRAAASLPEGSLYLALYENGLSTQVGAGENRGELLHHERVVRRLLGPYPLAGAQWSRNLHVTSPGDAQAGQLGLTAFVQTTKGDTLQALSLPLASCTR